MKNRRGFTLIELLAVVVILGLLLVFAIPQITRFLNRSKNENIDSQRQTLVMASQSYTQSNTSILPKAIGENVVVKASDLKKANFLKEDIVNADGVSCMENSAVRIYKYDTSEYSYTAYVYCGEEEASYEPVSPTISLKFEDENGNPMDVASSNVGIARVSIVIEGGKNGTQPIGLSGYSYSISVKYNATDEYSEIYDSGSINAYGKDGLTVRKSLTEYIDVTTTNYFLVTVDAYNRDGGYKKQSFDSETMGDVAHDTTGPKCGTVTGSAIDDEDWITGNRKITVQCEDTDQSECVKSSYTKTFTEETEYGIIKIKDNAGNTTECTVDVHIDRTKPTLTIKAYPIKANGTVDYSDQVGEITANHTNDHMNLNKFKYTHPSANNFKWLNATKYEKGIHFEVKGSDNSRIDKGIYSANETGLKENSSKLDVLSPIEEKRSFNTSLDYSFDFASDGCRVGKYELYDKAGNFVVVDLRAYIDLTKPTCKTTGGSAWTHSNVTVKGTCGDDMSGCKETTITRVYVDDINTNKGTPGTVEDNAGNQTACPATALVQIDNTAPTGCSVVLNKWINNSTRPTAETGIAYTAGTWSNLRIFSKAKSATDPDNSDGSHGIGQIKYYYTTTGVVGAATKVESGYKNLEAEGTSTIRWQTCDGLNNCAYCGAASTVKVDTVAPKCTSSGGSTTWINASTKTRTIYGACEDATSGCLQSTISKTYGQGHGGNINSTKESPGTVEDNAGNKTTCPANQTVKVDLNAPRCDTSGGNDSNHWTNGNVTITGTCVDTGGSDCVQSVTKTYKSNTNSNTESPGTVKDKAGNSTVCASNRPVHIDKTKPTCSTSGGGKKWTNKNVTLTGTCSDTGGSGCERATKVLTIDQDQQNNSVSPGEVCDNAGNCVNCPGAAVWRDTTAPSCKTSGGNDTSHWKNTNLTIYGTCEDKYGTVKSGCATNASKTFSSNTSGGQSPGTVKDNAGNTTTCDSTQGVYIDKTAPTCSVSYSNQYTTSGVTTTVYCSDSGGSNCAQNTYYHTGQTANSYKTVKDNAGNSGGCWSYIASYECNCYTYQGSCGGYAWGSWYYTGSTMCQKCQSYCNNGNNIWSCGSGSQCNCTADSVMIDYHRRDSYCSWYHYYDVCYSTCYY